MDPTNDQRKGKMTKLNLATLLMFWKVLVRLSLISGHCALCCWSVIAVVLHSFVYIGYEF